MPIYGYRCTQCGHTFEVLQSITEAPLRECPNCMGPLQKMLYPVGVIYKGSGFYTTDYKNAGSGSSSTKSEKSGSGVGEKSEAKSDGGSGEASGGGSKGDSSSPSTGEKAAS